MNSRSASQSCQLNEKPLHPVVFMPQAKAFSQTHAKKVTEKINAPAAKMRSVFMGRP